MKRRPHPFRPHGHPGTQSGVLLLEALSAILIFSLGVLSIIQLQSVSIKQSTGAQYRSQAAFLANDLISRMWVSDKTAATLQSNFSSSPAGASYTLWLNTVQSSGLPNVATNPPKVTFTTVPGSASGTSSSEAQITVYWQAPGDATPHQYVAIAQLK